MQASLSTVEAPSTPGTCKRVGVSAYGRAPQEQNLYSYRRPQQG
jgi:hypothetical protein